MTEDFNKVMNEPEGERMTYFFGKLVFCTIAGVLLSEWVKSSSSLGWLGYAAVVGTTLLVGTGLALILALHVLGDAYRTASAFADGRFRVKHAWHPKVLRYGLGFLVGTWLLFLLGEAAFLTGLWVAMNETILGGVAIGVFGLAPFLWALWFELMTIIILSQPVAYLSLVVLLTPLVWLARIIGLEWRIIWSARNALTYLDEENRFVEWATPLLDRWGERLATRSHAAAQPPDTDAHQ
jgi:hypothetical protein